MGITGLIPFLEKASSKINIKDLKGTTVAIDTYCWLHKGAYGCAEKLGRGESTNIHILYCLKFVNMLLNSNIKPILVFDGRHLPAKALTEQRRRESRQQAKKRAAELLRLGKVEEARVQMRRCIDITHDMVVELMHECRKLNVDCIVAPYEADAQLAYLNKINIAQYVITEDSDLTLFGAKKIIFKLDLTGNCVLVENDKLHLAMGCRLEKYTFDKFRKMCILSGCDYLDSLPGIGLAKACKFILKTEETDMRRALKKIPQYLNMKNLTVTDDYIEEFLKAESTFKYMFVFDPFKRKMVRLNDVPNELDNQAILLSNAGSLLDNETSFKLALGNLNPFTLEEVSDWNPDYYEDKNVKNSWTTAVNKAKHSSIWHPNYKSHTIKRQTSVNAFCVKKVTYASVESYENEENGLQDESSIASLYCTNEPPAKRKRDTDNFLDYAESELDTSKSSKHNPFAKPLNENSPKNNNNDSPKKLSKLERLSKFKRTSIDNSKEVKSRFFSSNTLIVEQASQSYYTNQSNITLQTKSQLNYETNIEEENISFNSEDTEKINLGIKSTSSSIDEERNEEIDIPICTPSPEPEVSASKKDILKLFEFKKNDNVSKDLKKSENITKSIITSVEETDVIEISDTESKKIHKTMVSQKKILKKKTSSKNVKDSSSQSQTRLSMFGFQKKAPIQRQ